MNNYFEVGALYGDIMKVNLKKQNSSNKKCDCCKKNVGELYKSKFLGYWLCIDCIIKEDKEYE